MTGLTIASWLLTYLIHSTVLLTAAWLVSRTLGDRHLQLQETLLRFALIGGLLTTTLQLGLGVRPLAGAFSFESSVSRASSTAPVEFSEGAVSIDATPRISADANNAMAVALVATWWLGSVLALLALGRSIFDLRRLLHTRRFRPTGRIIERLAAAMGLRREVRLSTSKAITVPFATGIRQPEICCPERICDLATEHQTGLFAHELAHLARRDPAWQLFYRFGEAIMCLQPLNRLVRRRLEEIAEHLTDERAVECTGNRLGLARCLVVLSHWRASSSLGVPASAFAAGPRLDRRVSRLLERNHEMRKSPAWLAPVVVSLLAAAVVILPTVASVSADSGLGSASPILVTPKGWSTSEDAPPDAPSAPEQPAPPDARELDPLPAPPLPEAVPAPANAPTASGLPVAESAPEPAAQPAQPAEVAPSAIPVPVSEVQPAPVSPPRQSADPTPRSPAEEDEMIERAHERAERAAMERARAEAERHARRAEYQKQRMREAEERAARAAAKSEERARERACRMAEDRERIVAHELRLKERAAVMAREATQRAEEHRKRSEERAIERERVNEERARQLAERARKIAEEAESRLLEERGQKDD
jgi:beta-lactamase regulating signal transducer with metallopeptidase domain